MISALFKKQKGLRNAANQFFQMEAAGGILLIIAAIFAVIVANSPLYSFYQYFLEDVNLTVGFSSHDGLTAIALSKPILLWINDGLMAIFFFLVGLEIKREVLEGELSSRPRALLPALAAIGGMVVPALIYYYTNQDNPAAISGWAIPAATDIAFALGVLALLGSRAPVALKILLTAIAIIDDLGAIVIIALFYTDTIEIIPLYLAGAALVGLFAVNRLRVESVTPYILLGFILWFVVLKSGVHATLAGVATAFFIPLACPKHPNHSPLKQLEHDLHPWIAFLVLPLFAFANAGVSFEGITWDDIVNPVTLGIAKGLFFGKQLGVFAMIVLAVLCRLSPKPQGTTWLQLYAVSLLCGVGFTMSLFVGELAFDTREYAESVRMGVIMGSVAAAILGYVILRYAPQPKVQKKKK